MHRTSSTTLEKPVRKKQTETAADTTLVRALAAQRGISVRLCWCTCAYKTLGAATPEWCSILGVAQDCGREKSEAPHEIRRDRGSAGMDTRTKTRATAGEEKKRERVVCRWLFISDGVKEAAQAPLLLSYVHGGRCSSRSRRTHDAQRDLREAREHQSQAEVADGRN